MNDKKICFIACVNDKRKWEESLLYINRLIVPPGYSIDVLSVEGAKFMTAGYNEGMKATDAKYKIYLHQDVFLVDRFFLLELIDIFKIDNTIGMIGLVGTNKMSKDGVMWNTDRIFSTYRKNNMDKKLCTRYIQPTKEKIAFVEAIDGLLMATQYDLPWREDLFKQWDFYDASQSFEFRREGYHIVVPILGKPMCVHDDGYILNLENYDDNRKIFLQEYGDML